MKYSKGPSCQSLLPISYRRIVQIKQPANCTPFGWVARNWNLPCDFHFQNTAPADLMGAKHSSSFNFHLAWAYLRTIPNRFRISSEHWQSQLRVWMHIVKFGFENDASTCYVLWTWLLEALDTWFLYPILKSATVGKFHTVFNHILGSHDHPLESFEIMTIGLHIQPTTPLLLPTIPTRPID